MSALQVFEDRDLKKPVEQVLYEGKEYFARLPSTEPAVIASEINRTGLLGFISWHPCNPIATIQFVNRVGLVRFFGRVFDVRSRKLLEDLDGKRQFEYLLDDLVRISRDIAFDYVSPTAAHRLEDKAVQTVALVERFNYYRHLVLEMPQNHNLEALVESILRNPHSRHTHEYIEDYVWNARRPTEKTFISLFHQAQHFRELPGNHPLAKAKIRGLTSADGKHSFFPLRASTVRSKLSIDTAENRFVKHFLRDVETVCVGVRSNFSAKSITCVCNEMLSRVRALLRQDFFSDVGELGFLPTSSPTLTARHGYQDLFTHYLNSRKGARSIFEDFQKHSRFIDLKDVAQLYEYWVFYSIVRSLLGEKALIESQDAVVKGGKLVQSLVVSHDDISITYNETFVRRVEGSYSVELRPDVVVRVKTPAGTVVILLDAKYKSRESGTSGVEGEEGFIIGRSVITADLHKMHTYVDAIEGAVCAMVVYPGTEFIFYPRDRKLPIIRKASKITSLEGVGAIPLLPGDAANLNEFVQAITQQKIIA